MHFLKKPCKQRDHYKKKKLNAGQRLTGLEGGGMILHWNVWYMIRHDDRVGLAKNITPWFRKGWRYNNKILSD